MLMQMFEDARRFLAGRRHSSHLMWFGQFGFACPQLGIDDFIYGDNAPMNAGINYLFNAALRNGEGLVPAFYIAPYVADATPSITMTAATFNSTLTEFINYNETTRPVWTTNGPSTNKELTNSTAPGLITVGSGPQTSIYGAVLHTSNVKSGTSGIVVAGARAPSPFLSLATGFEVKVTYRLTGAAGA